MPALSIPRRWARQPQGVVGIDRNNPLGRTVTHCLPLNGIDRDIVTGAKLTRFAAASNGYGANGVSLKSGGAAACASVPVDLSPFTKLSLSCHLYIGGYTNTDSPLFEHTPTVNSYAGFHLDPCASDGKFWVSLSGGGYNQGSIDRPAAGWNHYIFNLDRTTGTGLGVAVFVNGRPVAVTPGNQANISDNFLNDTLYLFSRNNASLFGPGQLQNVVIRGGYLMSAAEAAAEYHNLYQIYAPTRRVLFFGAGQAIGLAADAVASANAAGAPTSDITLSGDAQAMASASGAVSQSAGMAGAALAAALVDGGINLDMALGGAASIGVAGGGDLSAAMPVSGGGIAASAAVGNAGVGAGLSGVALASAQAGAQMPPSGAYAIPAGAPAMRSVTLRRTLADKTPRHNIRSLSRAHQ